MSKIVLMAPGGDIAKHAYRLQEKLGNAKHFQIVHGYMESAAAYAKKYLDENVDVIIARGNTAKLMKAMKLRFPIVTIPISNTEIIDSIRKARELSGRADALIGYIGLEDTVQGVQEFLEMMNCKITFYPVESSDDLRKQIAKAKNDGAAVVIGGIRTQQLARESGMDSVLLESSLYSITRAYEHAKEVQRSVLLHKKKLEERNTIIDSISEGVVGISEKGRITLCNSPAQEMLRTEERLLKGAFFDTVFKATEAEAISGALNGGRRVSKHAFGIQGAEYELDINPVVVRKKSKGVIATIRRKEQKPELVPDEDEAPRAAALPTRFSDLVGESLAFQLAVGAAKRFAPLSSPLILSGGFGVGKETFASCIHRAGPRESGCFVSRRANSLTVEDLLAANRGTLYIDEVSELEPEMARRLLDLIDRGIVRTPQDEARNATVRVIAGTTRNLMESTELNRFDRRLYYALNTFILDIPGLEERKDDIPLLLDFFLDAFNREFDKRVECDASVLPLLLGHAWRGNLRELANLSRRLVALSERDETLTERRIAEELGDDRYYRGPSDAETPKAPARVMPILAQEGFVINRKRYSFDDLRALDAYYKGKKDLLAEKLGVSRSTLWRYFRTMEDEAAGG